MDNVCRRASQRLSGRISAAMLLLTAALLGGTSHAQVLEWGATPGGGGTATGGSNVLTSAISQTSVGDSVNGSNYLKYGFEIAIPDDAALTCTNGAACSTSTCYGPSTNNFVFANNMCGAAPCAFKKGSTQYYQYLWQTSNSYTHAAIQAGSDWSDTAALCPGGACDQTGTSMTLNPTSTSDTWYLVARSYNGGQCAGTPPTCDGLIGSDTVMGPYKYDNTVPTVAGTVTPANTNYSTTFVDGTFDISVGSISDTGCAGVSSCEYTTNGGTNWYAATYAAGTCSKNSATCADGAALTINMRATDANGNVAAGTAVTRTCDAAAPVAGTVTPASTDTGTYVDATFDISTTFNDGAGSGVASCQHCVATDGTCDTEWAAGTWSAGTCSTSGRACTDGSTLTINMRATDNVGNTGTGAQVTRTCDTTAPTCSISAISEAIANAYYPGAGTTIYYRNASAGGTFSVTVTSTDGASNVQKVNFPSPNSLTGCGDDASNPYACTFTFSTATTQSGAVTQTAYDNVGNTSTCAYTLTRDNAVPTGGSVTYTDGWYTSNSVAVTFVNGTDALSGIANRYIQRDEIALEDGTGNCGTFPGTWGTTVSTNPAASPYTDNTVTSGKCYKYRYRVVDNVGNVVNYTSTNTAKIDSTAPNAIPNCAAITLCDTSACGSTLTWGGSYSYNAPNSPYMTWSNPTDNPASTNSGVAGYYVYFGTNSGADPQTAGTYQAGTATDSQLSLTSGTNYYFITKTRDTAGNISAASTACQYRYSAGGYLTISTIDTAATTYGGTLGSTDNPEGILAPDNSDYEIVTVSVVDESDTLITTGPIASKQVTLTLSNIGTTGAYIASTGLGSPSCTPGPGVTACTGTLSSGTNWIKVKANGSAPSGDQDAVLVTPTAAGLSGQGGRNQVAALLVRTDPAPGSATSNVDMLVENLTTLSTPDATQTIFNPVWNSSGNSIAFMSKVSGVWDIYKKTYSGGWGAAVKLTNSGLSIFPAAGFTFSPDGQYVIFSATSLADSELELFAVKSDGSDNAKTQAQLDAANQKITNKAYNVQDRRRWADSDWSPSTCTNGYQDNIVASMGQILNSALKGVQLYRISGSKAANGLFTEGGTATATVTQLTSLPLSPMQYAIAPRWSHDCTKIVFQVMDNAGTPSKMSVYVMNLTDSAWASTVASFPVTSLTAQGMYKIHGCDTATCPLGAAFFPSFSAANNAVFMSVDTTKTADMRGLQNGDVVGQFYTGKNFDNYAVYIGAAGTYTSQKIGQSTNNEFGITQCYGASCPDTTYGKPITYVTQSTATTGSLLVGTIGNESTVTSNGGVLFYNGAVTAVFPPGAVSTETILAAATPSMPVAGSCGGYAVNCNNLLASTGEAREFFPDGVIFNNDIQLVFHYCDTDADGYLDNRQDSTCSGGTGGSSGIDENMLYVYYWCDANGSATVRHCTQNQWQQLNGNIDPSNNMISVITNHFSTYDLKALLRGALQAGNFAPVSLNNPHTFPNPWRSTDGLVYFNIDSSSTFTTTDINAAGGTLITNIEIFDISGRSVRTISNTLTGLSNASLNGGPSAAANPSGLGLNLASWDATNNSGKPVASGVYVYSMTVSDGWSTRGVTGKLAIVK